MLEVFLAGPETREPIVALRRSVWAYPIASWFHILGIALLFGTIAIVDLCLIGFRKRLDPTMIRRTLVPLALGGFGLAVATGLALFAPAGREYLANPYFLLKLGLIGAAGEMLRRPIPKPVQLAVGSEVFPHPLHSGKSRT